MTRRPLSELIGAKTGPLADDAITLALDDVRALLARGFVTIHGRTADTGMYWVREAYAAEDWDLDGEPDVVIYRAGGHKFMPNRQRPAQLSDEIMALSDGSEWQHPSTMERTAARLIVTVNRDSDVSCMVRLTAKRTDP